MEYASDEREYDVVAGIRQAVGAVWRRWYVAAGVAALVVLLGLAYIWFATTLYSASVEILIDPRSRRTVEAEVSPSGLGSSAAGADTLLLESQVELLRSHNILDALIKAENLDQDPEFAGTASSDNWLKTLVKSVIYGPNTELSRSMSPYDRTVRKLRRRMEVDRKRNTYVISISVQATTAEKAARLANRLAEIYVADVNAAGSDATREAATALASRLDTLRASVNETAAAVEQYRRDNNLVSANQTLVVEQQLGDLNRELARARLDVQTATARRNQFRAAVEAVRTEGGEASVEGIGESAVVERLQTRLADVESQLAELALVYQDRHPRLRRLQERRDALKASLTQELTRVADRLDVALKTAEEKAEALVRDVKALEERMSASNSSSVQLRELEREAASVQAVYESFLRRSKEAREQIDIPQSTARIISVAYPASRPSDPPALLILVGSVGLGLGLGVLAAIASSLFAAPRVAVAAEDHTPRDGGPKGGPKRKPRPEREDAPAPRATPALDEALRALHRRKRSGTRGEATAEFGDEARGAQATGVEPAVKHEPAVPVARPRVAAAPPRMEFEDRAFGGAAFGDPGELDDPRQRANLFYNAGRN